MEGIRGRQGLEGEKGDDVSISSLLPLEVFLFVCLKLFHGSLHVCFLRERSVLKEIRVLLVQRETL